MKPFIFYHMLALVVTATSLLTADEPKKLENFALEDVNGVKHTLTDYTKYKAVVLMFISTQCPVSNGYNTRMATLQNDYRTRASYFLGSIQTKQNQSMKSAVMRRNMDLDLRS